VRGVRSNSHSYRDPADLLVIQCAPSRLPDPNAVSPKRPKQSRSPTQLGPFVMILRRNPREDRSPRKSALRGGIGRASSQACGARPRRRLSPLPRDQINLTDEESRMRLPETLQRANRCGGRQSLGGRGQGIFPAPTRPWRTPRSLPAALGSIRSARLRRTAAWHRCPWDGGSRHRNRPHLCGCRRG
jgi:hypothetical protein